MMKLKDLKKTIALHGGATLDHTGAELIAERGYMVSLAGSETITTLEALTGSTVHHYLKQAKKANAYFGLWNDNGKLYLDLSIKIEAKADAIRLGKRNKQKAIYDITNAQSVYLED